MRDGVTLVSRMGEAAATSRVGSRRIGRGGPRLLVPALALAICSLVAASAAGLYGMRQHTLDMAIASEVGLLNALSQDMVRDVESYDLSLQGVIKGLAEPGLSALSPRLQDSVLFDNAASADWLGPIVVLDRDGRVTRSSDPTTSAADIDYRKVLDGLARQPDGGLYVDRSGGSQAGSEEGAVVMARALRSDDGILSGAVVGTLRATYFRRLFSTAGLGWHQAITLTRTDGTLLAREPDGGEGADVAPGSARLMVSRSGTFRDGSTADGAERIQSYVRLVDLPVVLAVSVAEDEILASWKAKAALIAAVLGALCATAAALGVLLTRQAGRAARAEDRLSDSEAQYRLLAEHGQDLILRLDGSLRPTFVSPASRALLGYAAGDLRARGVEEIVHPDDLPRVTALIRAAQSTRSEAAATYRVRHADGHLVWVEGRYSPVPDGGFIVVVRDVSERKTFEERLEALNVELRHAAHSDGLTGLANRRRFDEALGEEWRRASRTGAPLSLLLLDVDRFKAFNDRYGHLGGDECLRTVADVIKSRARRPGDVAARYGGEEFAMLLPAADETGAAEIAESVRAGVESLGLRHEGNASCGSIVTISIGCVTQGIVEGDDGPASLVASADAQLYAAKDAGRNGVAAAAARRTATVSCAADGARPGRTTAA